MKLSCAMRGRSHGQITLFLSLMLVVLISFLCTALQSARTAGSRYLFTLASEAVTQSVFGAYDTKAWEQYRILMVTDEALVQQIGTECAERYQKNGTMFPLEISSVELAEIETLAENGAAGWEAAAVSYMEARIPVEAVSWLVEQTGLIDGLDNVTQWLTGFKDLFEPLVKLEQKLCKLEKKLSKAVDAFEKGKQLLEDLKDCSEAVSQAIQLGKEEADLSTLWSALEDSYEAIQEYIPAQEDDLDTLVSDAAEELSSAGQLEEQIQSLLESLEADESLGLSTLSGLGDYQEELRDRFGFLQGLPGQLEQQRSFLRRISRLELPSMEEVLSGTATSQLTTLSELTGGLVETEWEPDRLEVTEGSEEDTVKVSHLLQLKDWLDQGILMLVLEDTGDLSRASLGDTLTRTERTDEEGFLEEAYRTLLYGEYALDYTASYGEDGGAGLQYETEYLIVGEEQDRSNLASVASRLLLIRGAMNLMYLLQDETKGEQVHLAAAGISAALGGWVPEALVAVLLMVLWALAEAVCDVRGLLSGNQVPFWKNSGSWQLAWDRLWTLFDEEFVMAGSSEGMTYEEYLRLLLFLVPVEEKCFRTMEIAAENLAADRENFQIEQAWYRAVVVVTGKAAGQQTQLRLEYGY